MYDYAYIALAKDGKWNGFSLPKPVEFLPSPPGVIVIKRVEWRTLYASSADSVVLLDGDFNTVLVADLARVATVHEGDTVTIDKIAMDLT